MKVNQCRPTRYPGTAAVAWTHRSSRISSPDLITTADEGFKLFPLSALDRFI